MISPKSRLVQKMIFSRNISLNQYFLPYGKMCLTYGKSFRKYLIFREILFLKIRFDALKHIWIPTNIHFSIFRDVFKHISNAPKVASEFFFSGEAIVYFCILKLREFFCIVEFIRSSCAYKTLCFNFVFFTGFKHWNKRSETCSSRDEVLFRLGIF